MTSDHRSPGGERHGKRLDDPGTVSKATLGKRLTDWVEWSTFGLF